MKRFFYSRIPVIAILPVTLLTMACLPLAAQPVTNGVSKELATVRKQSVSNINYEMMFLIPSAKDSLIEAAESISFTFKKTGRPLQVDFKGTAGQIRSVSVNNRQIPVHYNNEHLLIDEQHLVNGTNRISILFIAGNQSLNRSDNFLYTLLVPDRARTVFPCFDQPDLKAVFTLGLSLPRHWTAQANGRPYTDSVLKGDTKTCFFENSDTISTYLFAFVAGEFMRHQQPSPYGPVNFLYRETDTAKVNRSLPVICETQINALDFFGEYTGIPYPFQKFDFAAIPSFQYGGMEHVGNVFYRSSTLFLDKGATQNQLNNRASLLAHETAHMWFGDLVTMEWFDDVWVKEVFAQFMADKFNGKEQPAQNFALKFLTQHYPPAYSVDKTAGANPIHQPLDNLKDAGTLYGDIIYHKAPIMMKQLELLIGEDTLRTGLRKYLKKYAFGNCSWDSLVQILDNESHADLKSWNEVWVNRPGRPVLSYRMDYRGNKLHSFILTQKPESGTAAIWPQFFTVAFIYKDHIDELPVSMQAGSIELTGAAGKEKPLAVIVNSSGEGYGVFPVDTAVLTHLTLLTDPVMRASVYISLYENMLNKTAITPAALLQFYMQNALQEKEELTLRVVIRQMSTIFWRFLSPDQRIRLTPALEEKIWKAVMQETVPGRKKVLFSLYQSVALSDAAKGRLYAIWKDRQPPANLILTDDDYITLAMELAVRDFSEKGILNTQLSRISDADRKSRLAFMLPALSPDSRVRDSFFVFLQQKENRRKEEWVTTALGYLHHPLRTATSIRYLAASLELIEEIQATGDIFFPAGWLHATLDGYQQPEAAKIVTAFLDTHKNLNPKLKAKVLQAADELFRAKKLVSGD
ncbi:MAG: M1 family aminopeptidase [Chitinophagaceae bacterium]